MQALDVIFSVQKVCVNCLMPVYLASSNSVENFVTRGYKHVGMRLAYFACPYPYAFVKREWRKRFGEPLTCADRSGT